MKNFNFHYLRAGARALACTFMTVILAAAMTGCDKNSGNIDDGGGTKAIKKIDITGAQSLFIAGTAKNSAATHRSGNGEISIDDVAEPTLYKVNFNGQTQKVEFTDADGGQVDIYTRGVINLSSRYVVALVRDLQNQDYIFLIRKSDGAVYGQLDNSQYNPLTYFENALHTITNGESTEGLWQTDKEGYVFFINESKLHRIYDDGGGIVINQSNINSASMDYAVQEGNSQWVVNGNGYTWYANYVLNPEGGYITQTDVRMGEGDGRYYLASAMPDSYLQFESKYIEASDPAKYGLSICRHKISGSAITKETLLEKPLDSNHQLDGSPIFIDGRIVVFSGYYEFGQTTIYHPTGIHVISDNSTISSYSAGEYGFPRRHQTGSQVAEYTVTASDKYVYNTVYKNGADATRNKILRFDPATGAISVAYELDLKYTINSLKISKGDVITINAFDGSTGDFAFFEVNDKGVATERTEYNDLTVVQLERLN